MAQIKLRNILTEAKDLKYYNFQVLVDPALYNDGMQFMYLDGKMTKSFRSTNGDPLSRRFTNVSNLIKSATKVINNKSKLTIWDDTGKGKSMPATLQNLRLIKR